EEDRDVDLEGVAGGGPHQVAAMHGAGRRVKGTAARVFEALPGLEHWLCADHAGAAHLLDVTDLVGDLPIARHELDGLSALVLDGDGVGPEELALFRLRLVGKERRRNAHLDGSRRPLVKGSPARPPFPKHLPEHDTTIRYGSPRLQGLIARQP